MTKEAIETLEFQINSLKDQLKGTAFDQSELEIKKRNARNELPKSRKFSYPGLTVLMLDFQEKYEEGWRYSRGFQSSNVFMAPAGSSVSIILNMPESMLAAEYAESDKFVEQEYVQSIENSRTQLMKDLAAASISLAEAKADAKEQSRKQKAFEQELEKIRKEFQLETPESEDNQDEKPTEDKNGCSQ